MRLQVGAVQSAVHTTRIAESQGLFPGCAMTGPVATRRLNIGAAVEAESSRVRSSWGTTASDDFWSGLRLALTIQAPRMTNYLTTCLQTACKVGGNFAVTT